MVLQVFLSKVFLFSLLVFVRILRGNERLDCVPGGVKSALAFSTLLSSREQRQTKLDRLQNDFVKFLVAVDSSFEF